MNYSVFSYNKSFYPNYNLFNSNVNYRQIGIGVTNPKTLLDINGNVNISNLYIKGNINYNNNGLSNKIEILKQNNDGLLKYKELKNTNSEWLVKSNELELHLKNETFNRKLNYYSNIFNINNSNNTINILGLSEIRINFIHINNSTGNLSNIKIVKNTINYDLIYINNNLYRIKQPLILEKKINNLSFLNLITTTYNIQLVGEYEYLANSLWKTINNNNLYINHNIGIFTNNPKATLEVNGNVYIKENIVINNLIKGNNIDSNITNIKGNLNISNIEANNNNLYINTNKKTIYIGQKNNSLNELFNINDNFIINDTYIKSNYLHINNNINIDGIIKNNKYNIQFNSNNALIYNNNSNNLLIDNNKNTIFNKLNIISNDNENKNKLCLNGNMYIDGDLTVINGSLKSKNNIEIVKYNNTHLNINTIITKNINILGNINCNTNLKGDIINIKKEIILPYINTTTEQTKFNNKNSIFYDKINNKFMMSNKTGLLTELITTDSNVVLNIDIKENSIQSNKLIVENNLNIFKNLNINDTYIYINTNTLREEIKINNVIKKFDISY